MNKVIGEDSGQCVIVMLIDQQQIQSPIWISLTFHWNFIRLFDYK